MTPKSLEPDARADERTDAAGEPRTGPREQPAHPALPRTPQQERGQRRVEAILDATSALIVEEGVAAVTMHRVARRSGTTTGSMYHFFPDRETLLRTLAERHSRQLRSILVQVERDAAQWSRLSTDEAVDRFLDPLLAYSERHPDVLPLSRFARSAGWGADGDAELGRLMVRLAETVLASRDPSTVGDELTTRALMMTAMISGVGSVAARTPPAADGRTWDAALRAELRRALVAYLDSCAPRRGSPRPRRSAD